MASANESVCINRGRRRRGPAHHLPQHSNPSSHSTVTLRLNRPSPRPAATHNSSPGTAQRQLQGMVRTAGHHPLQITLASVCLFRWGPAIDLLRPPFAPNPSRTSATRTGAGQMPVPSRMHALMHSLLCRVWPLATATCVIPLPPLRRLAYKTRFTWPQRLWNERVAQ